MLRSPLANTSSTLLWVAILRGTVKSSLAYLTAFAMFVEGIHPSGNAPDRL